MSYKIEFGGDGVLRLMHYQNKEDGGVRVMAEYINGHVLEGIVFRKGYVSMEDLHLIETFIKASRGEIDLETFRTGN